MGIPFESDQAETALARELTEIEGLALASETVETNILFLDCAGTGWSAADLVSAAKTRGVGLGAFGPTTIRAVTHLDVGRDDVLTAIEVLRDILAKPMLH